MPRRLFRVPIRKLAAGVELVGFAWFQGYQESLDCGDYVEQPCRAVCS